MMQQDLLFVKGIYSIHLLILSHHCKYFMESKLVWKLADRGDLT